jgi:hypothetical protein
MILDRASIITIIFVFSLFVVKPSAAQTFARGNAWGVDGASYEDPAFTSVPRIRSSTCR